MKLGQVVASSSQTFTLDYVPEYVGVLFGNVAALQSITVTTNEGTLVNLDGVSLQAISQSEKFSPFNASKDLFLVPVGAGMIPKTKCTIYVSTTAAGLVDIYATSTKQAVIPSYYKTYKIDVLANGNTSFKSFGKLAILSMGSTDVLTYNSNIGSSSDRFLPEEVAALGAFAYNNDQGDTVICNSQGTVASVIFSPVAQRTCVVQQLCLDGTTDKAKIEESTEKYIKTAVEKGHLRDVNKYVRLKTKR
jgi:hypothetical protein